MLLPEAQTSGNKENPGRSLYEFLSKTSRANEWWVPLYPPLPCVDVRHSSDAEASLGLAILPFPAILNQSGVSPSCDHRPDHSVAIGRVPVRQLGEIKTTV
jgi:hypothetical protein